MLDFGQERTETYVQSLTQCLELLGDNPQVRRQILKSCRHSESVTKLQSAGLSGRFGESVQPSIAATGG